MTVNAVFTGQGLAYKLWGTVDVNNATYFEVTPSITFVNCLIALAIDYNVQSANVIEKLFSFAWVKADSGNNKIKFAGTENVSIANSINYLTICR